MWTDKRVISFQKKEKYNPIHTRAEGVATSKGGRSGWRKEGRRRGVRRGAEVRGGEELSVHDMNEPCSVTEA